MCTTCGCEVSGNELRIFKLSDNASNNFAHHSHETSHHHEHHHEHERLHESNSINIEKDILTVNDKLAERNRGYFEAKEIFAINLVSSPGSGKTTLLERTIRELQGKRKCYVVEGDQQTDNDARRIAATGVDVVQINTGNACHLDAHMINHAVHDLKPDNGAILFIENVGNLVCPALFDLGENIRVVIFSVTEGEDKPLKYPNMFSSSQLVIINKIDLLPYLSFDIEVARRNIQKINGNAQIIELSATTGEGFSAWVNRLVAQ